jgi:hypothetical protein
VTAAARRVYLSGGMEYAANEGRDWRETMQRFCEDELGWTVFNPNHESERFFETNWPGMDFRAVKTQDIERYREIVSRLVDIDSHEIAERTDIVVCYWDEGAAKGAGTKGELTMARFFGKPVYMVTTIPAQEIPGWVLGCTTRMFRTFSELTEFLRATRSATTGKAEGRF